MHQGRIEDVLPEISGPIDAVSARALAPLPELIAYAAEALDKGAVGVFLKGEQVADELTPSQAADRFHDYEITSIPSVTSASGRLLIVKKK